MKERPKKVLGIVTSLRPGGNSEMLARVALRAASRRGAQTDMVFLRDLKIEFCDGCLACVFKTGTCHRQDDVHWLYETARAYDGLILSSPTYMLGAPAQVKALVDRSVGEMVSGAGRPAIPVGTIAVAGIAGWDYFVRPALRQLGLVFGGRLVGDVMAFAPGPAESLLDSRLVNDAEELGVAVLEDRVLEPPEGVCPVCHLPTRPPGTVAPGAAAEDLPGHSAGPCPFCLHDPRNPDTPHRFTPHSLGHFMADWMLPTRDRFLARKAEVKAAAASLLETEVGRRRPEPGLREESDGREEPGRTGRRVPVGGR
ncbi:MAG: flavodoxin family protein [Bacillota bacterium]|nr:MAG: flavodoxin family protein [Bacillota bacterium]